MMCSPWSFLIELSWLQKIVGDQTRESLPLLIRAVTSLEGRLTPRPGSPIIPCLRGKVGVLYFCSFVHSARLTAPGRYRGFFHQNILLEKLIFFMWLLRVSLVKVDLREISKSISELPSQRCNVSRDAAWHLWVPGEFVHSVSKLYLTSIK